LEAFLETFLPAAFFFDAFLAVFLLVFLAAMSVCLLRSRGTHHMKRTHRMLHDVYCHLLRCVNEKNAMEARWRPGMPGLALQTFHTELLSSIRPAAALGKGRFGEGLMTYP
jgi:hypothetical protein